MVHLMGRSKGFISRISRLERGKLRFPTLALVMDYLRVCRASFAELVPLLDSYTQKPVPLDQAGRERVAEFVRRLPAPVAAGLDRYDIKTAAGSRVSAEAVLEPDERVLRIRKQAQAWLEWGRLDQVLNKEMDNLGVLPLVGVRKFVFDYGHKLWRILKQTRSKPGQLLSGRQKSREARLTEAEAKALAAGVVPIEGLRLIRDRTISLFKEMAKTGQLDHLPSVEQALGVAKPLSLLFRGGKAQAATVAVAARADGIRDPRLLFEIQNRVAKQMTAAGIVGDRFTRFFHWLQRLLPIALETQPGSEERARRTEALVNATRDPKTAGRVAQMYFTEFEKWRGRLFGA